jgi:hypothetical protein
MTSRKAPIALTLALLFASAARAQAPSSEKPAPAPAAAAPSGPPRPPPELDKAFRFLDGTWKCTSKFPEGAMGPGSPAVTVSSTVKFRKDLKGFFYRGEYQTGKANQAPQFHGILYLSYVPGQNVYTLTSVDDMGGVELATSTGFEGDTITFSGESYMMGQKVKVRETISRQGKAGSGHTFEADLGKGFQLFGEDTCRR